MFVILTFSVGRADVVCALGALYASRYMSLSDVVGFVLSASRCPCY